MENFTFTTKETRYGDSIDTMGYFGPRIRLENRRLSLKQISGTDVMMKMGNVG